VQSVFGTSSEALVEHLLERGSVSAEDVARARELQAAGGGDLAWILGSLGSVGRRDLYDAMAEVYGIAYVRDVERLRTSSDISLVAQMTYEEVVRLGFMPFQRDGETLVVITPSPGRSELRAFCRDRFGIADVAELLVTDLDLTIIAARTFRDELVEDSVQLLYKRNAEQSARRVFTPAQIYAFAAIALAWILWFAIAPISALIAVIGVMQIFYLAAIAFKFALSFAGAQLERAKPISAEEIAAIVDESLPVYTVLVPVYKEPEVVGHLIGALKALDYPQHKLDVILLLEEDDTATLNAARAARPPVTWRFLVVPNSLPRTKPKACNYGLVFARGEFLVIYDAEDLPLPDQLKMAVAAFRKSGPEYMCFQAALNYFNADENLLTRMFTLEYSYWFDYLVPGLDRLNLPIPLGGTSNHFRVETLRELGGWDPYNTTEDADLGIRASAQKLRVGFINSTTYEEANNEPRNWIRQRSRWVKGYMQTFLVYCRHPLDLMRRIGVRDFCSFALFIGGTPVTFLVSPVLYALFLLWLITKTHLVAPLFPDWVLYTALANLLIGNFLGIYLNMIAIFLRGNYRLMPYALLNPAYWMMHSIAAYKALGQLFTKPFYWEKTQHGITKVRATSQGGH
jgi:cellulose synthase/poly-beta-1,6-N-acetylglucosamine synthase-like glycosyltransferase